MKKTRIFMVFSIIFALFMTIMPLQAVETKALGQRTVTHYDTLNFNGTNVQYSTTIQINSDTNGLYTSHVLKGCNFAATSAGTVHYSSLVVSSKTNGGAAVTFKLTAVLKKSNGTTVTAVDYFTYSTYGPYSLNETE